VDAAGRYCVAVTAAVTFGLRRLRCAFPKCQRILTGGKAVIVTRDGRRYCKHHCDRLPAWLRRPVRTEAAGTRVEHDDHAIRERLQVPIT
jgi:hypothetical protein